jgi:hypothetical protein
MFKSTPFRQYLPMPTAKALAKHSLSRRFFICTITRLFIQYVPIGANDGTPFLPMAYRNFYKCQNKSEAAAGKESCITLGHVFQSHPEKRSRITSAYSCSRGRKDTCTPSSGCARLTICSPTFAYGL